MKHTLYKLSGIADEAGPSLTTQIEATKALGWSSIEARNINGINIHDLPESDFERVEQELKGSGIQIDCFASAVANWAKDPLNEKDFEQSVQELQRAIPRMKRLNTRFLRGMSFRALKESRPDTPEIEDWIVQKLNVLVSLCREHDIVYLHENCANFGGLSWEHTLRLVERVDSPHFRLVFDTGNPVGTYDRRGKPWQLQDSLEFFNQVNMFVDRIHIKDGRFVQPTDKTFNQVEYRWPGEGDGKVVGVLDSAIKSGFAGTISIEPHIAQILHDPGASGTKENRENSQFNSYVEYGKRLMDILDSLNQ